MAKNIQCCQGCVPPVRHMGCHSTCEIYKSEKAQYDDEKEQIRQARAAAYNYTDYLITTKHAKTGRTTRDC